MVKINSKLTRLQEHLIFRKTMNPSKFVFTFYHIIDLYGQDFVSDFQSVNTPRHFCNVRLIFEEEVIFLTRNLFWPTS